MGSPVATMKKQKALIDWELAIAGRSGDWASALQFVAMGADPLGLLHLGDSDQESLALLKCLVASGTEAGDPIGRGRRSLLSIAAANGEAEALRLLLELRENDSSARGESPLHLAAGSGHDECVRLLLEAGADPNGRDEICQLAGNLAAADGHAGCLRLLLEKGMDFRATDPIKRSPGHWAAEKGNRECIDVLIEFGWHPGESQMDELGETPLNLAAGKDGVGAEWLTERFLKIRADIENEALSQASALGQAKRRRAAL